MFSHPILRYPATYSVAALIAIVSNLAFFVFKLTHQDIGGDFGFIPAHFGRDFGLNFITSFFIHANELHLLDNLFFLIIFGRPVENQLGAWRWTVLLACSVTAGDLVEVAFTPRSLSPLIGASGGISGLIAFYVLKFPHESLGTLFKGVAFLRYLTAPAWVGFVVWTLLQLRGVSMELNRTNHVASLAHLGGMLGGLGAWALWRNRGSDPMADPAAPTSL